MNVQREMCAVEDDVIFKCDPQLPAQRASYRLQPWPEQSVMHDQKIDVSLLSLGQNGRGYINRCTDTRNSAGIFNLETVKRIVPVAHFTNAQNAVRVTDNLQERCHDLSVAAFVSNAE